MLESCRILFLDFQTTGPKPESGEILEVAWATSDNVAHELLVRPERTVVSPIIQKITGINEALLADAVTLQNAVGRLADFLKTYSPDAVVIHYAKFEQPFLEDILQNYGFSFQCPVLCTHEIAKRLYPNLPARGVAGLAGYFGWSMKEKKRGQDHVQATKAIWNGLLPQLASLQLQNVNALQNWLQNTKPAKKTKYEYPLDKAKRLNLPVSPGLYRMIGKNGEVLYVGKATCLRDRVNSYFRGQKNRNSFKLQMLAQVWDIKVTTCDTPLEAALLECDEIKKWSPRYNVVLKNGERELSFYSRNFTSAAALPDTVHVAGPFSNRNVLNPMLRLAQCLNENAETPEIPQDLFFEPIDSEVLKQGFKIFCETNFLNSADLKSVRAMLCLGMKWHREQLKIEALEALEETEDAEAADEAEIDEEVREYTAEEVAEKFQRLFRHSASALRRSKKLKKLLNCEVEIRDEEGALIKTLVFRHGALNPQSADHETSCWDIATYDRLTVLYAESKRLGHEIVLKR